MLTKLDKKNREDRAALIVMRALLSEEGNIDNRRISNARYTTRGLVIDLSDGSTINIRITARPE